MSKREFLISKIFAVSGLAVVVALANQPAFAQQEPQSDAAIEEVVVTGIRISLEHAMDIKRESGRIVDSVASESLGKFPDTNIAESLQRITGVSIDRSGGEGQSITVRGFGPQFNPVLLNGRRMVSDTGGRSFNFDVLPEEMVSRVDVYKSAVAALPSGGIGSTVIMHTPRPLDIRDFKAVVTGRLQYEELSGHATPQLFGMVNNTFLDNTAGFLLSVSHEQRKNRTERYLTDGILTSPRDGLTLIADDLAALGYAEDDQFFIPQNFNISPIEEERERLNVNSTLQYQPADELTLTLDAMYGEFDVRTHSDTLTFFVTPSIITEAQFDETRTVTSHVQNPDAATDFTRSERSRPTETSAVGFNADWNLSEDWNLAFDTSWSRTESLGTEDTAVTVMGYRNTGFGLSYDEYGVPSYSGVTDAEIQDPSLYNAHFTMRGIGGGPLGGTSDIEHELMENRLDFTWNADYGALREISFGALHSSEDESTTARSTTDNIVCLYCGYFVDLPDDILRPAPEGVGYLDGEIDVPDAWQTADIDDVIAFLESDEAAAARDEALELAPGTTAAELAAANGFDVVKKPNSTEMEEKVRAAYVNFDLKGELSEMPWRANLGLRYEQTETTAFGISPPLLDLLDSGDPTLYVPILGEPTIISETNKYDHALPSLDVRLNLTDDLVARFAASKTMTRPPFVALSPRMVIGTTRPGNLQASRGNPNLKPYVSKNLDLAMEWYYQDSGYLTAGLFRKSVDNFLVNTVQNQTFIIPDADDLFDSDPVFEVSTQDNLESAYVEGVELGLQHTFDWLPGRWKGFGITANAILVNSDAELDVNDVTQTFALEGLGDSYNVVGFYTYGDFEARLAWNSRDRFLQNSVGFGGEPTYVKDFAQIDARVSYAVTDYASLFIEGVNIADEKMTKVGRYDHHILLREQTGPRYVAGIRVEF